MSRRDFRFHARFRNKKAAALKGFFVIRVKRLHQAKRFLVRQDGLLHLVHDISKTDSVL